MTEQRRQRLYRVRIGTLGWVICLALVFVTASLPISSITTHAQLGTPLLSVYADPTMVVPGQSVSFTVIASGSGSRTQIDVLFPNDLTLSNEVGCVHSALYCDGWSVASEDSRTNRLTVIAPGNIPGPDGPRGSTRVTVTFTLRVPVGAIPGSQIQIISSVDGLFDVLEPLSTSNNRIASIIEVLGESGQRVPAPVQAAGTGASIQVTKKRCAGRATFPVFVESHCVDVPDATFTVWNPLSTHAESLSFGESYVPDESHFGGSNLWTLEDSSSDVSTSGERVISCLESKPGSGWHSSVPFIVNPADSESVLLDWMATGAPNQTYQPSLECVWFELPDIGTVPAVLSLQVFSAAAPYLNWTETTGPQLPDVARGESGEDLEAAMVMTNTDNGEVYSFAADAYGQVLVPAGTYALVETANGLEEYFSMQSGQTTLVEVGLSSQVPDQNAQLAPVETSTFYTGAIYCDSVTCSEISGVSIYYESLDGTVTGSCITEEIEGPNGTAAWCDYEYVVGMPTILTLDESTLPPEWVLVSENPQTYLVPENPDGELGPVYFELGPA